MSEFRYHAIEINGVPTKGVIEAEDRKTALQLLGNRGLFPSSLEACSAAGEATTSAGRLPAAPTSKIRFGARVSRREITAFTRELGALLGASIPIPQALDGLGEGEGNPALRKVVLSVADSVRKGASLSAALEEHPRLFSKLYVSIVRVGEEAGVLPQVMADLVFFFQAEDGIRDLTVTGVQTCALPI